MYPSRATEYWYSPLPCTDVHIQSDNENEAHAGIDIDYKPQGRKQRGPTPALSRQWDYAPLTVEKFQAVHYFLILPLLNSDWWMTICDISCF